MNSNLKIPEVLPIPIYRKSNKRERKPMKYYIKFIGFTLFEKETYLL